MEGPPRIPQLWKMIRDGPVGADGTAGFDGIHSAGPYRVELGGQPVEAVCAQVERLAPGPPDGQPLGPVCGQRLFREYRCRVPDDGGESGPGGACVATTGCGMCQIFPFCLIDCVGGQAIQSFGSAVFGDQFKVVGIDTYRRLARRIFEGFGDLTIQVGDLFNGRVCLHDIIFARVE